MLQDNFDHQGLETACIALSRVLHELLKQRKIDAQEFLSIVGQMPIKMTDLDIDRWRL
ncbi:hypothetical protein [Thermocoleostomius sinensis]|uniref:Uncharacterized protein n=1 Tax=Thermocoleostomius sinensis A174 TaxID=2016057 RepID=A0A9E8Z967_9CYAN|nr:hypothetical protein [Thermocoleostomius sinensis]WAL58825.1 hypothetical protein OXH18_16805 [Thermocoleostomius sinensis A174]